MNSVDSIKCWSRNRVIPFGLRLPIAWIYQWNQLQTLRVVFIGGLRTSGSQTIEMGFIQNFWSKWFHWRKTKEPDGCKHTARLVPVNVFDYNAINILPYWPDTVGSWQVCRRGCILTGQKLVLHKLVFVANRQHSMNLNTRMDVPIKIQHHNFRICSEKRRMEIWLIDPYLQHVHRQKLTTILLVLPNSSTHDVKLDSERHILDVEGKLHEIKLSLACKKTSVLFENLIIFSSKCKNLNKWRTYFFINNHNQPITWLH